MIENVRQFYLKNANGATYDMTRPEALFYQPDGLGWGIEATTKRLGEMYVIEQKHEQQPAPSGQMIFRTYDEYNNFKKFIQISGLTLYYSPAFKTEDKKWFCLDVEIQIGKGEIDWQTDHLICPVYFTGLSYWYELKVYETLVPDENGEKKYNYTYPYRYGDAMDNIMQVDNNLPSYFRLYLMGVVTDPQWEVIVNGKSYAKGKINYRIPNTQMLVVDSNPKRMEISAYRKTDGKFATNLYQYSDFTTTRIFALPAGECAVVVSSDEQQLIGARLEVMSHV